MYATLWYLNMCVAVVLQWCCSGVAVMLQCVPVSLQDATGVCDCLVLEHMCYSVLQWCCIGFAVVLQWCCSIVAVCCSVAPGADGCARLCGI